MVININKENCFPIFLNVSKTCQDRLKVSRNIEIECLSHAFQNILHELETLIGRNS